MRTIPIGPLWCYSVTCEDYLSLITIGDETWIRNFEAGPTRHHISLQGQINSMSSAVKIMTSFLWCGGRIVPLFLTFWDHIQLKHYYMDTIKKNELLNLTNLSQENNVWWWCHTTHKSVQPLNGLYCSTLLTVQTSPHWINTYFILSRKNCKYNIMRISPWRISVTEPEEQQ